MSSFFSQEEFKKARSKDLVSCICDFCKKDFKLKKHYIQIKLKKPYKAAYCSIICQGKSRITSKIVKCIQCSKEFKKTLSEIKKSLNHFCSRSCSATYNNTHKTKGIRRSKLEAWLEHKLPLIYPNLEFHFNRKDSIDSELDIYIPSLKLAFELNGIFHYEPIFGEEKLKSTKNNDNKKLQLCSEKNIKLYVIDTSKQSYFRESSSIKFLQIIKSIIDS